MLMATALTITTVGLVGAPAAAEAKQNQTTTTLSFPAHPDDDLLFMSPDITSDVQAGYNVWVVYLTAGELPCGEGFPSCGMAYADMRIQGERAAYARAARVPNEWTYESMYFGGREVATNRLNGTNVHLVFTFIHAAAGRDQCGDLYRMVHDDSFVAQPIDGRAAYTKASFVGTLRSIITTLNPNYIRTQSSIGHREPDRDHVDHIAGTILAADADTYPDGTTRIRRDEYQGYVIRSYPDNVFGYWRDEKTAVWNEYRPRDPNVPPGSWDDVMGKQYRPEGRVFQPGTPWVQPPDFNNC